MARSCTVCAHPESFAINEAILGVGGKLSNRSIAKQYDLDHNAVQRHKQHIPELLLQARDDLQAFQMDSVLSKIENLERETLRQLEEAKADEEPDRRVILLAIREQRNNLELLAKLAQLIDNSSTTFELHLHPEWVQLRTLIVEAVQPYPAARDALLRAIDHQGSANNGLH